MADTLKVVNLSATKIGIGSTQPAYALDIVGSINYTGSLMANGVAFSGSSQWTTTGSNVYYNTGNVGIGATNPTSALTVGAGLTTKLGGALHTQWNDTGVTPDTAKAINSVNGGTWSSSGYTVTKNNGSNMFFCLANNLQLGATYQLTFTATGNISVTVSSVDVIGDTWSTTWLALTGTPQTYTSLVITATYDKVYIYTQASASGGTITISALSIKRMDAVVDGILNANGITTIASSNNSRGLISYANGANAYVSCRTNVNVEGRGFEMASEVTTNDAHLINRENAKMHLRVNNGTYGLSINTDGTTYFPYNMGIGTTTPQGALDVNGMIYVGTGANVGGQGMYINTGWINSANYNEYAPLQVGVRGTKYFVVNTNGNVGIGTSGPGYPLEVVGAITSSSSGNNSRINMTAGNGSFGSIEAFNTANTAKLPIVLNAWGGSVGIGTASPVSLLHVNGIATASQYNMSALTVGDSGLQGELTNILNLNLNVRGTVQSANAGGMFRIDGRNAAGGTELFQWIYKPAGGTTSSNIMSLDSAGVLAVSKIGISNSSPNTYLCVGPDGGVNGSGNIPGISMKNTATSTKAFSIGQDDTHNVFLKWVYNATVANGYGAIQTYSSNNPLSIMPEGGNVGIGLSTPAYKLDVSGTVRFTSPGYTGLTYTSGSTSGYSISAEGTYGPFVIDPNFGTNSYVQIWDQLYVSGTFSSTNKYFAIPHPVKDKREQGLYLYHSCVESPNSGDTIERFQIVIDDTLQYTITMPDYYSQLCNNMMVMIQSVDSFGRSKYNITITNDIVQVHVNVSEAGTYNVMVMGTRCDKEVQRNNFQLEKMHENGVQQIIERCAKKQKECLYCADCCPHEYV
jgi:hypothetical protein